MYGKIWLHYVRYAIERYIKCFRDMFSREKSENITINEKELMEKNSRDTKLIDALNELGRGTTE